MVGVTRDTRERITWLVAVTLLLPVSRLTGASTRVGCSTASTWPPPAEAAAAAQQRARMIRRPIVRGWRTLAHYGPGVQQRCGVCKHGHGAELTLMLLLDVANWEFVTTFRVQRLGHQ